MGMGTEVFLGIPECKEPRFCLSRPKLHGQVLTKDLATPL